MALPAAPWTGFRRAALPLVLVLLLLPATAVRAQRLLTLVPGVAAPSSTDDPGPSIGPVPTAVQVDLDLLRSGPAWLETPTPDGSVLWAERSVFEDRGGGDLMWSGGHPDAGYDTVVLTVEGGRLVGRFAAAGGGAYQIHAERDGRGGMAPIGGPRPVGPDGTPVPFCAVETAEPDALHAAAHAWAGAPAAEPPRRVAEPQSHDRLDILVAYTATAAENWADRGGAMAAIRHAGDYLKMVFRNNELPVEPHIVHVALASPELDRAGRALDWHDGQRDTGPLWKRMDRDGELLRLRHEHRADFVHVFTGEHRLLLQGACGAHRQLIKGYTARSFSGLATGWTTNHPSYCGDYVVTFAHEIGHGLGAHHDRANLVPGLSPVSPEEVLESLVRLYSLGYANFGAMPSVGTAMSYQGQTEPFFSTARFRHWGAAVGIADEAENERTLRETVHIAARYSDYHRSLEDAPAPPGELQVQFEGGAALLSWRDNAPDADGYEVEYLWESRDRETREYRLQTVEGRVGATLFLDHTESGSLYRFKVRALKGSVRSLNSSEVWLVLPGEPVAAPSDVSATVSSGLGRVDVRWTDNSDNERGFDVQLLQDGEPIQRELIRANDERASFLWFYLEPRIGAEYGVRVFAFSMSGYSESSGTATFRWEHPQAPGPVADLAASVIGPTTVRVTWTADPEVDRYVVRAKLWRESWRHSIRWYPSPAASSGAAWVDFEGLARGGRYRFEVDPWHGRPSSVYLTLGERGAGPEAPSDLSLARHGGNMRLSWKDNSSDETGFEIQRSAWNLETWTRFSSVPPDTESVEVWRNNEEQVFRVYAYNERGYSAGSPGVPAVVESPVATAGDSEVELSWAVLFPETSTGTQVRWKATSELPFDDSVDVWTDLSALVREYTVTGLDNGTEYTFAVRALAGPVAGTAATATATPQRDGGGAGPDDEEPPPPPPSPPGVASLSVTSSPADGVAYEWSEWIEVGVEMTENVTVDVDGGRPLLALDLGGRGRAATYRGQSGPATLLFRYLVRGGDIDDDGVGVIRNSLRLNGGSIVAADGEAATLGHPALSDQAGHAVNGVEPPPPEPGLPACEPPREAVGLDGYRVFACYETQDGATGYASGRRWSDEAGLLWFFDPANVEVLIKVLDGCAVNGRRWVFLAPGTDLKLLVRVVAPDGEEWTYRNPVAGETALPTGDTGAFTCVPGWGVAAEASHGAAGGASAGLRGARHLSQEQEPNCTRGPALTLRNGYEVTMCWWLADGSEGGADGERLDGASSVFWFFDRANPEVLVKVLDGCSLNGHWWVFASGATDLAYEIEVAAPDGWTELYEIGPGLYLPLRDLEAFECRDG